MIMITGFLEFLQKCHNGTERDLLFENNPTYGSLNLHLKTCNLM